MDPAALAATVDVAYRFAYLLVLDRMAAATLVEQAVRTAALGWGETDRSPMDEKADLLRSMVLTLLDRGDPAAPTGASETDSGPEPSPGLCAIGRALELLPPECRVVTALSLADELSAREIAALLSMPASTVRARLQQGRALLRESLGDFGA